MRRNADEVLEGRIDSLAWALPRAPDRDAKLEAWHCLARLIAQRSPQQVERLERARGLRP